MDKIRLLVPPSDTAQNSERWYEFAIYLSRATGLALSPVISGTAEDYQQEFSQAEIIYCTPELIPTLIREFRFIPLMQPAGIYEEVAIVSGPAATLHRLSGIQDSPLGGIKGTFANRLGLTTLTQKQIRPAAMAYRDNWLQLLKAVQQGDLPYALLSKQFMEQLSPLSLSSVNLLARSNLHKAYPLLLAAPQLKPHISIMRQQLQAMSDDPKGAQVLEILKIQGWKKPTEQSIIDMVKILRGK
ncbi:PhnD/SsuA/transferrin family substrate-binding protein [uncultured Amphritea sp.]|uniref:PhnD/SsuA/transferrin family substrate-binding protein n=1 Tax=uncultured Amphritea sp. TaxID=981605 RepID=UPI00260FBB80|nr:PhnD/SsuA/transferrin family substrate-binding protein [uncultured Amphritea sp.]